VTERVEKGHEFSITCERVFCTVWIILRMTASWGF
jgi:hypothetical protein